MNQTLTNDSTLLNNDAVASASSETIVNNEEKLNIISRKASKKRDRSPSTVFLLNKNFIFFFLQNYSLSTSKAII